jgi:Domain of unknown function (DUF4396)
MPRFNERLPPRNPPHGADGKVLERDTKNIGENKQNQKPAIKADTLALTAFEIGLFAWMAFIYFQFVPRSELTSPTYWFMMQIGMVLGFIASFPVNWYLVRAGVKPGM